MSSGTERQLSVTLSCSVSPLGTCSESMLRLVTPYCYSPCPQVMGSYSRHKQRCLHGSKRCYESKTWQGKERRGQPCLALGWVFPSLS